MMKQIYIKQNHRELTFMWYTIYVMKSKNLCFITLEKVYLKVGGAFETVQIFKS